MGGLEVRKEGASLEDPPLGGIRLESLPLGGSKVIASLIKFQCLFFILGDLLNSSVKNIDACT